MTQRTTKHWIAVASAEHVRLGQAQGFMQVCHGKGAPLRRLQAGDRVVYYSPVEVFGSKQICQAFTAIGVVLPNAPYQASMLLEQAKPFHPFRRDVHWLASQDCAIRPLLPLLEFSKGKSNWAFPLRFGLVEISAADMLIIARAMRVSEDQFDKQEWLNSTEQASIQKTEQKTKPDPQASFAFGFS